MTSTSASPTTSLKPLRNIAPSSTSKVLVTNICPCMKAGASAS